MKMLSIQIPLVGLHPATRIIENKSRPASQGRRGHTLKRLTQSAPDKEESASTTNGASYDGGNLGKVSRVNYNHGPQPNVC